MAPSDCVFCRIVAGTAPAWVVYEDDHVIAFLDTKPIAPGHILVCPKDHAVRLTDLEDAAALTGALQRVARLVEQKLAPDYNLGANQGPRAGQVVFHHHWHVIPRYEGEAGEFWGRSHLSDEEAKRILAKLGVEPVLRAAKETKSGASGKHRDA